MEVSALDRVLSGAYFSIISRNTIQKSAHKGRQYLLLYFGNIIFPWWIWNYAMRLLERGIWGLDTELKCKVSRKKGLFAKQMRKFRLTTTQIIMLSFMIVILIGSVLLALPVSAAGGQAVRVIGEYNSQWRIVGTDGGSYFIHTDNIR